VGEEFAPEEGKIGNECTGIRAADLSPISERSVVPNPAYARVPVGDRQEIYGLKSAAFRDWLIGGYFADQGEPGVVKSWA
jgi:hypothetical protein